MQSINCLIKNRWNGIRVVNYLFTDWDTGGRIDQQQTRKGEGTSPGQNTS